MPVSWNKEVCVCWPKCRLQTFYFSGCEQDPEYKPFLEKMRATEWKKQKATMDGRCRGSWAHQRGSSSKASLSMSANPNCHPQHRADDFNNTAPTFQLLNTTFSQNFLLWRKKKIKKPNILSDFVISFVFVRVFQVCAVFIAKYTCTKNK